MVMAVEVGAVAAASADNTMQRTRSRRRIAKVRMKTSREAHNASQTVITTVLTAFFLRILILKNSPTLKAMNASAISEMKSVPAITVSGIRSRQQGPMMIPTVIYAVTFGNLKSCVSLVIANPQKSIIATDMITIDVFEICE